MTIFTLPRAFTGKFRRIQTNAITSWRLTCRNSNIVLFGDEMGTREICKELKLEQVPDVEMNHYGTPYVNEFFLKAQEIISSHVLCCINSDMILLGGLESLVSVVQQKFHKFLLVARRWDLDMDEDLDFSRDWKHQVIKKLRKQGKMHRSGATDSWMFTNGLYPRKGFPRYLLGRYFWDGWLMYEAARQGIPVIDITSLTMVHQTHVRCKEGLYMPQQWAEELFTNRKLCNRRKARVTESSHVLVGETIQKRSDKILVELKFTRSEQYPVFCRNKLYLKHGETVEVDRARADRLLKHFKGNLEEICQPDLSWKDKN